MIRIKRLKVEIHTESNVLGFDDTFSNDTNIICSEQNTSGKSSIISSIYYGLGLEEIIGGRGFNVLSSAFKTKIHFGEKDLDVLESKVFIEVSNGKDVITILRTAKIENRESNLMTIYYSNMNMIYDKDTISEDMYVHSQNSATNQKGYFKFLEDFLELNLPKVPTNDDTDRKLYLQLIFSSMLIEQKRGWADIFSGMPHFGIKEPKKRVIEYLLNMDTLNNEKLKHKLKNKRKNIEEEWNKIYNDLDEKLQKLGLVITGIEGEVKILDKQAINIVYQNDDQRYSLDKYIELKNEEYKNLIQTKPKDIENFQELKDELDRIEEEIVNFEEKLKEIKVKYNREKISLDKLLNSLTLIQTDIINNQDARKLRNLGSKEGFYTFKNTCPTCNQIISDSLLVSQDVSNVMSIEENINHLKSQEKLFEFAIDQKKRNINKLENDILSLDNRLSKLYQLAKVTKNDIFAVHDSVSESTIYKKVEINNTIEALNTIKIELEGSIIQFQQLSNQWREYLIDFKKLPKHKFTKLDESKLKALRNNFVTNLTTFGYRSSANLEKVKISKDTYMPVVENFDLKFDSSASDHIRRIWAFTIALAQTSSEFGGNHPGFLIFDEPGQHSIVVEDMEAFLDSLNNLSTSNQIIVGITIKETDTRELIYKQIKSGCKGIIVQDWAFGKF